MTTIDLKINKYIKTKTFCEIIRSFLKKNNNNNNIVRSIFNLQFSVLL